MRVLIETIGGDDSHIPQAEGVGTRWLSQMCEWQADPGYDIQGIGPIGDPRLIDFYDTEGDDLDIFDPNSPGDMARLDGMLSTVFPGDEQPDIIV